MKFKHTRGARCFVFALGGAVSVIFSTNKTTLLLDFRPLLLSIPTLQGSVMTC